MFDTGFGANEPVSAFEADRVTSPSARHSPIRLLQSLPRGVIFPREMKREGPGGSDYFVTHGWFWWLMLIAFAFMNYWWGFWPAAILTMR